jgi:hypothetical protein
MPARYCKKCGNKIPKHLPHTNKKTAGYRKFCYNCSPLKTKHPSSERVERKRRKEVLVKMLGGCCSTCGYNLSIRALSFHHKDPSKKKFDISSNGGLMENWDVLLNEARKCKLLCLNCHAELHNDKKAYAAKKKMVKNRRKKTRR